MVFTCDPLKPGGPTGHWIWHLPSAAGGLDWKSDGNEIRLNLKKN